MSPKQTLSRGGSEKDVLLMGSLSLQENPGGGTSSYRDSAAPGCPGTAWSQRSQEGTGMVGCWGCRRMSTSQAGKHSPAVGATLALPPSTSPALPSCPPKHGQKGVPGLQLGHSCRESGWEPQPGQSQIPSKGSAMRGEPTWRPRVRVWWDFVSGHWMDTMGSRSIPCSCPMLWHSQVLGAKLVTGASGDRPCAGMCCTDWCHQLHPHQGTGDGCSTGPRASGEMEEPVEGCRGGGSSTAAPRAAGASQGTDAVCWVLAVGQSRLLSAQAGSGLWAEELEHAGRWCWVQDAGAGRS